MSFSEAELNSEIITVPLTHIGILKRQLEGKNHRFRARAFVQEARNNLPEDFLGTFSIQALKYIARLFYVQFISDLDFNPSPLEFVLIGHFLAHLVKLPLCPTCGLTHGVWCDETFNAPL
jgi:hypothetical protein